MLFRALASFGLAATIGGTLVTNELGLAPCEAASAWVAWNSWRLPTTLADFERFDASHRKAIFGALSVDARRGLLREKFERVYRAAGVGDSVVSRLRLVQSELDGIVLGSLRGVEPGSTTGVRLRELSSEVKRLLPASLARELLSFGGSVPSASTEEECDRDTAYSDDDECPKALGFRCRAGSQTHPCEYDPFGCGTWWLYSCDGLCQPPA